MAVKFTGRLVVEQFSGMTFVDSVVIVVLVDHDSITQLYYISVRRYFTLIETSESSTFFYLSGVPYHFS